MDRMTSSERMACLFAGKRPDRVPVIPHMEAFAGVMCGMSTYEWYNFPENAYRSQIWCQELFGYDGGKCYDVSSGIAGDFPGGEVVIPQEPRLSLPYASRLAAPTEADVEKLTLPRSIDETFDAKRILEFNRICYRNGEGVSVFAGSPTSVVQYLVGAENMVRWMIKKPELVHRLMRFATDYIYFLAQAYLDEFGPEPLGAGMACPLESNALLSPRQFETFCLPYLVEIFETYREWKIPITGLHLCGRHDKNLPIIKANIPFHGRTLITVGAETDLEYLGKVMGPDFILGGNVRSITLQNGTPEEVYAECAAILKKMKYFPGGFVLTPECTISYLTPPANFYAMLKAARELGAYDPSESPS